MGRPGVSFTEELQAVGKAISLVSVVQVLALLQSSTQPAIGVD